MTLIRYEYPTLTRRNNDLNRWFDDAFRSFWLDDYFGGRRIAEPAADLYEDDDNVYVRMEVPGVKKKELEVSLENAVLTVSAEASDKDKESERSYSFRRTVSLPEGIDGAKVKARLEDGILTITAPKAEERKARVIDVK